MQVGKLRLTAFLIGTQIDAGHPVEQGQFEPDIDDSEQASGHELDFTTVQLVLGVHYVLVDRLELGLTLPVRYTAVEARFLDESGREIEGFSSIHHRTETLAGLGDMQLTGRYRVVSPSSTLAMYLDVSAGVSLPTGHIEPDPYELGRRGQSHQHMFFGTGTFDPSVALSAGYVLADYMVHANVSFKGSVYENRYNYLGPKILVSSLSLDSALGTNTWRFRAGAELNRQFAALWSGEPAKNSSRLDVGPVLGVTWLASEDLHLGMEGRKPFVLRASGTELNIPFYLALTANVIF